MSQLVLKNILAGSGNVLAGGDNSGNVNKVTIGSNLTLSGGVLSAVGGGSGSVTSVAVSSSGDALTITGSPITSAGTINIGFAGTGAQYIKGDGTLATFPTTISQAQKLITEVYNETGATLTKGTVVYINGGHGNLPTITKAIATGDSTSAQTYGVVQSDIANNNNGFVVVIGSLIDMDTQAYTAGTQLYLSSTTAGAYTSVKQYAPAHLVYVGIVVRSHPTQGVIEIRIQNGFELDELHNVSAQSPSNGDILQYNSTTSLWTAVAGTTTNIAEGTNLYFTNARARGSVSVDVGSALTYNSTTGRFSLPAATALNDGYLTALDYADFDSKQASLGTGTTSQYLRGDLTWAAPPAPALEDLTDVTITSPTNGQLLRWQIDHWENWTLPSYVQTTRTLTINGTAYDLSANRTWSVGTITDLTGEATASGTGSVAVTLTNSAVIGKVLTGLNVTGGSVSATDSILTAFGKVQNQINGLIGGSIYKGTWNASTNTPALASSVGTAGWYYIVSVAGSTNLNGITDWQLGDWAIFNGGVWQKVDNTDSVVSVNGFTGAVSLTTDNISEGATNLYYTNTRARGALSANPGSALTYNSSTGRFTLNAADGTVEGYVTAADYNYWDSKQASLGTGTTSQWLRGDLTWSTVPAPALDDLTDVTITTPSNGQLLRYQAGTWINFTPTYVAPGFFSANAPLSYNSTTGVFSISQATTSTNGYLSSTDWNTFNNKQSALTNPVTGTGTTNTLPKFTGTSTIGNSIFTEDGGNTLRIIAASAAVRLDGSNDYLLQTVDADGRFRIYDQTAAVERLTISSVGNVGIGSISPSGKLEVNVGSSAAYFTRVAGDNGTTNPALQIGTSTSSPRLYAYGLGMEFFTAAVGGTGTLKMILDSSGKLGIGTSSPNELLSLNATGNVNIHLTNATSGTTTNDGFKVGFNTSLNAYLLNKEAGSILFYTSDTLRATIDASGNLGLGVTPSAWQSGLKAIQVGARLTIWDATNASIFGYNVYSDSSATRRYIETANAMRYIQNDSGHSFQVAASGTAGSAITFTQAMTLTSGGNLLVNTTTDAGYKLDVNGTGRFTGDVSIVEAGNALLRVQASTTTTPIADIELMRGTNSTWGADAYGDYRLRNSGGDLTIQYGDTGVTSTRLTIASTGAATFASTVRVNGGELTVYNGASVMYTGVDTGNNYVYFGTNTASYGISFQASGDRMRIFPNGNVAIGTTTDAGYKLDVSGTGRFASALTVTNGNIQFGTSENVLKWTSGNGVIEWGSAGTLYLRPTGAASNSLTIASTGAATFTFDNNSSGVVYKRNISGTIYELGSVKNSGSDIYYQGTGNVFINADSNSDSTGPDRNVIFGNRGVEYARITSDGNALIGTTTSAGAAISLQATSSAYSIWSINDATANYSQFYFGGTASSGYQFIRSDGRSGGWISLGTQDTERMRITSGGNVGIGTSSPVTLLDVQKSSTGGSTGEYPGIRVRNTNTDITGTNNSFADIRVVSLNGTFDGQIAAVANASSTYMRIGTLTNHPTTLWTNSTERMRIDSTGNFIFKNDSTYWQEIFYGTSQTNGNCAVFRWKNTGLSIHSYGQAYGTQIVVMPNSANVAIGTTTDAGYKLDVSGQVRATAFFESSDKRLKKEIIDNPTINIEGVKPKLYIKDGKEELGYYAQDLQEILPSSVTEGKDGFLSLSYTQVHTAKIASLEKEVAELKELIKTLIK